MEALALDAVLGLASRRLAEDRVAVSEQADRLQAETAFMRRRWSRDLDRDPYWNPNLSLSGLKRELAYRPRPRA